MNTSDLSATDSLSALRARHRRGTLSPLVAAVMSEADPDWLMLAGERQWRASAAAWGLHLRRNGIRPKMSGDAAEQKLARWEARQRDTYASGLLGAEREKIMLLIEVQELLEGRKLGN
jgi:hypothetical protein